MISSSLRFNSSALQFSGFKGTISEEKTGKWRLKGTLDRYATTTFDGDAAERIEITMPDGTVRTIQSGKIASASWSRQMDKPVDHWRAVVLCLQALEEVITRDGNDAGKEALLHLGISRTLGNAFPYADVLDAIQTLEKAPERISGSVPTAKPFETKGISFTQYTDENAHVRNEIQVDILAVEPLKVKRRTKNT